MDTDSKPLPDVRRHDEGDAGPDQRELDDERVKKWSRPENEAQLTRISQSTEGLH